MYDGQFLFLWIAKRWNFQFAPTEKRFRYGTSRSVSDRWLHVFVCIPDEFDALLLFHSRPFYFVDSLLNFMKRRGAIDPSAAMEWSCPSNNSSRIEAGYLRSLGLGARPERRKWKTPPDAGASLHFSPGCQFVVEMGTITWSNAHSRFWWKDAVVGSGVWRYPVRSVVTIPGGNGFYGDLWAGICIYYLVAGCSVGTYLCWTSFGVMAFSVSL